MSDSDTVDEVGEAATGVAEDVVLAIQAPNRVVPPTTASVSTIAHLTCCVDRNQAPSDQTTPSGRTNARVGEEMPVSRFFFPTRAHERPFEDKMATVAML